jgi:hypothetical protein
VQNHLVTLRDRLGDPNAVRLPCRQVAQSDRDVLTGIDLKQS